MDDAFLAQGRSCGTFSRIDSFSSGLYGNDVDPFVIEVMVVQACGIATSPYAGNYVIRIISTFSLLQLPLGLLADDCLKTSHHVRIRMGSNYRTNNVVGVYRIVDPIAYGFIGRIF